jgi:capsular polysaccharide transport system permease protein
MTPFHSLYRSLMIQLRVIAALLMREVLTRYGRHNIGFLWLFAEPMLFTVGVTALWSIKGDGFRLPITAFAITGYSSVLLWRSMPSRCSTAIEPNLALMYHRNVNIIDLFLSRILLEIAGTTTSFVTLALIFHAMGRMALPENVLQVIFGWLMLAWFGSALGLLIGALSARNEIVEKFWHPIAYLLFPLSGALFMVDWLPPALQQWVLLLPMVHGVEILREGFFGSTVHAHYNVSYMAMCCLLLTLLALAQERIISRQVIPE